MEKSEERSILKAISILGGTQVLNIAVGIVRNKAASVFIGAAGMGCVALYHSTSDLITTISNMGISTTAVKNISSANSKNDIETISIVIAAFRKVVVITGIIASFICIVCAPLLSYINFGNYNHIADFFLLSLSLFEIQMVAGYTTLLQGCRKFKLMAKATLMGNVIGLFICIPLYYFFRYKAIIPVLILYPLINYLVMWKVSKIIELKPVRVTYKEAWYYGRNIIKTGFYICLQSLFSMLYIYILRLYLSNSGGLATVGLFSSGMLIVNQYVGLVFSSMGTEYYPRLAAIDEIPDFISAVNMQIRRCVTFLSPLISVMILFMPLVIRILYTEEFLPVVGFSVVMLGSVSFKIIEWCIGFSLIAKGRTKVFFINEVSFKMYLLFLSFLFYNQYGLIGVGIAYLIAEILFSIQSILIIKKIWHFSFQYSTLNVVSINIIMILLCLIINLWYKGGIGYTCTIGIIIIELYLFFRYIKKII